MAEYKSFHYLMHQVPDAVKPVYVTGPAPLTYAELYSPRASLVPVHKSEKSFWRTRDRVEFCLYEDRTTKTMVVTCRSLDKAEVFRTIFLDLEVLYFELEAKAQGNRDKLVRKKDKKLNSDELLHKAAAEFVLARINIGSDPLPWPDFAVLQPPAVTSDSASLQISTTSEAADSSDAKPTAQTERMCTFTKLSSDVYESMEINKPAALKLEGMEYTKLQPTATASTTTITTSATATSAAVPSSSGAGASTDSAAEVAATPAAAGATVAQAPSAAGIAAGKAQPQSTNTTAAQNSKAAKSTAGSSNGKPGAASKPAAASTTPTTAAVAEASAGGSGATAAAKPAGKGASGSLLKNNKVVPA
jgi:hypothetical protein